MPALIGKIYNMGFSDFYKGDKKKKKKGQVTGAIGAGPVFTLPTVAPKGKSKYN